MIDFQSRLKSLKDRRQGSRERAIFESLDTYNANQAVLSGTDIRESEEFENLKEPAGVKYAIGAMAPVGNKSTEVSIREGDRVADSLIKSLENRGESVTKRLQGSVALDIHIQGHSDVDMLIIVKNPVFVESPRVTPNNYLPATDTRGLVNIARDVRLKSESILPINFPSAIVDTKGNKSIAVDGGSLRRKVDIVPAIWYDSINYQSSGKEHDRGIQIYHKEDHQLLLNYPFTHIKNINEKDSQYSGNLKCVIRLMKNMIADMPEYKKRVAKKLTSYDLAGIAYHMNSDLFTPSYMRLALVEKIRAHLSFLNSVQAYRETLYVPDGTRKIFDSEGKSSALEILTKEFSDLATAIFKELAPSGQSYNSETILNKAVY
jgi:hypothetical protein